MKFASKSDNHVFICHYMTYFLDSNTWEVLEQTSLGIPNYGNHAINASSFIRYDFSRNYVFRVLLPESFRFVLKIPYIKRMVNII